MFNLFQNFNGRVIQLPVISRSLYASNSLSAGSTDRGDKPKQSPPEEKLSAVAGLSSKVLNVPADTEVGPGASKTGNYKNVEYFCYHPTSYFDAEIEMNKYRLPQPSAKRK